MKECTYLTCNRPSDSWENGKKSELEKMATGRSQGERAKEPLFLLLLFSSYSLPRLFSSVPHFAPLSTVHYPLSTVHCPLRVEQASSQWAREFFSNGDARDLQMSIQEHLPFLKAHDHAATIPALALVKRHFFLYFPFCCRGKFLVICF